MWHVLCIINERESWHLSFFFLVLASESSPVIDSEAFFLYQEYILSLKYTSIIYILCKVAFLCYTAATKIKVSFGVYPGDVH